MCTMATVHDIQYLKQKKKKNLPPFLKEIYKRFEVLLFIPICYGIKINCTHVQIPHLHDMADILIRNFAKDKTELSFAQDLHTPSTRDCLKEMVARIESVRKGHFKRIYDECLSL